AFAGAHTRLGKRLTDGTMMRGDILHRWQELMAGGGLIHHLDHPKPKSGGRLRRFFGGGGGADPEPQQPLTLTITEAVTAAIRAADRAAIDDIVTRWRGTPAGTGVVEQRGAAMTTDEL